MVVVRGSIYYSDKWKFFTDFLFEYGMTRMGTDWRHANRDLPPDKQHPLYRWQVQTHEFTKKQTRTPEGYFEARPNGSMAACYNFYYDLYTVDDNTILEEDFLNRLRHRQQFQGAAHELFTAASCLRAGFSIMPENEKDPSRKHAEFVAVHNATGQHVLVEAKSRHRAGVFAEPGVRDSNPDIRFRGLINKAIEKDPKNPLAIFVDTNLPPARAQLFYTPISTDPIVMSKAMSTLIYDVNKDYSGVSPYNLLVFSNHPNHYSDSDVVAPTSLWAGVIAKMPRVPVYHPTALTALLKAVNLYGKVPTVFPDDQNSNA